MREAYSLFPGGVIADSHWPPISSLASKTVTLWPRSAAPYAAARPATPAPATKTFLGSATMDRSYSVSRQVWGLAMQLTRLPTAVSPVQPWLQPMQWMISSVLPALALFGSSGSASEARAMTMKSAFSSRSIASDI